MGFTFKAKLCLIWKRNFHYFFVNCYTGDILRDFCANACAFSDFCKYQVANVSTLYETKMPMA